MVGEGAGSKFLSEDFTFLAGRFCVWGARGLDASVPIHLAWIGSADGELNAVLALHLALHPREADGGGQHADQSGAGRISDRRHHGFAYKHKPEAQATGRTARIPVFPSLALQACVRFSAFEAKPQHY